MRIDKSEKPLSGVKCVVNTCIYNKNGSHCTASSIEIEPKNASSTEETGCVTFAPDTKG